MNGEIKKIVSSLPISLNYSSKDKDARITLDVFREFVSEFKFLSSEVSGMAIELKKSKERMAKN